MYANVYEMKMPTNYVDMNADELEYTAAASGNGEYRKNKPKVKSSKEYEEKALDYTLAYVTLSLGIISIGPVTVVSTILGGYQLGRSMEWW